MSHIAAVQPTADDFAEFKAFMADGIGTATQRPAGSADAAGDVYQLPAASSDATRDASQVRGACDDASDASHLAVEHVEKRSAGNGGLYAMREFANVGYRWLTQAGMTSSDASQLLANGASAEGPPSPGDPYAVRSPPAPPPASNGSAHTTGTSTQCIASSADAGADVLELPAASDDVTAGSPQLPSAPDDASDASQLAGTIERRRAANGDFYTMTEFASWYGEQSFRRYWEDAAPANPYLGLSPPAPRSAPAASAHTTSTAAQPPTKDASQLPAGADDGPPTPWQLMPWDVIGIQNAEAALGPPRSLHNMARDALNRISASPSRDSVLLDDVFPWMQYVAAHRQAFDIIGPGITRAMAMWKPRTNDNNRGGAERLDLHFFREDGTVCRVHPGGTRRGDARLIF